MNKCRLGSIYFLLVLFICCIQLTAFAGPPPAADGHKFKSIRFFEAGSNASDQASRTYGTSFSHVSARYIYGEVLYSNKNYLIGETPFKITLSYRAENDQPAGKVESMAVPMKEWKEAIFYHGVGWDKPGYWQPGNYTVYVYFDDQIVGQGQFRIEG